MISAIVATAIATLSLLAARPATTALHGVYDHRGHAISIGHFPELGPGSFLIDYRSGRSGRLIEIESGRYCLSASVQSPAVSSDCIRIQDDGLVFGAKWFARTRVSKTALIAKAPEGALACALLSPANTKVRSIVLLIYGSGPATIDSFDPWTKFFVAIGYGAIACDKRGLGDSAGDWRDQDLAGLANDARAAISAARAHAPGAKLAAWGISQGGWIVPQLLASGDADFAIMHAGSLHTPAQQTMDYVGAELRAYGFEGRELDDALAYYRLDLDVTLGKTSWSEIDRAFQLRRAEGREWLLGAPAPADAPERRFLARIAKFDPLPYWKKSTRPVLAIFGEKDRIVPPDLTPNDRALLEGTNTQSRIVTIPAMNHVGLKASQGTSNEIPSLTHFAPGYWDAMSEYMAALTGEDGGK